MNKQSSNHIVTSGLCFEKNDIITFTGDKKSLSFRFYDNLQKIKKYLYRQSEKQDMSLFKYFHLH